MVSDLLTDLPWLSGRLVPVVSADAGAVVATRAASAVVHGRRGFPGHRDHAVLLCARHADEPSRNEDTSAWVVASRSRYLPRRRRTVHPVAPSARPGLARRSTA